jgi:hypothetical protein
MTARMTLDRTRFVPEAGVEPAMSELPIHARAFTTRFSGRTAVDGIDVDVARGEAFGFLGPNGEGRQTRSLLWRSNHEGASHDMTPAVCRVRRSGAPTAKDLVWSAPARHLCAASAPTTRHRVPVASEVPGSDRFRSGNPRDLAVKSGIVRRPSGDESASFAGRSGESAWPRVLLAMQRSRVRIPSAALGKVCVFAGLFGSVSRIVRLHGGD